MGRCGSGGTGNTGRDDEVVVEVVEDTGRVRPDRGGTELPYRRPSEAVSTCSGEDMGRTGVAAVDLAGTGPGATNVPLVLTDGGLDTAGGLFDGVAGDSPPFCDCVGEDDISRFWARDSTMDCILLELCGFLVPAITNIVFESLAVLIPEADEASLACVERSRTPAAGRETKTLAVGFSFASAGGCDAGLLSVDFDAFSAGLPTDFCSTDCGLRGVVDRSVLVP